MSNPYDVGRSWPEYFLEHRKLFEEENQGTYQCGDLPVYTVHSPLGYLGNSTFIIGTDGVIVYDTGVNAEAGTVIAEEIRKVTDLPIRAIFYSHHHTDHYNGTTSIVTAEQVASGEVRIYAWANFLEELANEFGEILPRQAMGVAYYGGGMLPPEERHHHGIGLHTLGGSGGYLPPTDLMGEDVTLEIAGVTLEVFYTGGEAISEFGIHLPAHDMVLIADEFFSGIPNMHTIRGSKPRIPDNYARALDRVIELEPEWLLGSHIMPIRGKHFIKESVTRYRDVAQYLWDQSIRLINRGYTPVELQHELAELPDHLRQPPYAVETYGTPFTTVPEFFTGWVSWFTGDAADMFPSPYAKKSSAYVELMGGVERVLEAAKEYHAAGEHQLAAELAQDALRAAPGSEDARLVKAAALRARGYQELNPIARSWYLTSAYELEGAFDPDEVLAAALKTWAGTRAVADVLGELRYKLDPAAAGTTDVKVGLRDTATGGEWSLHLRHSVLVVTEGLADGLAAVVEIDPDGLALLPDASGFTTVEGDADAFGTILGALDFEQRGFAMNQR